MLKSNDKNILSDCVLPSSNKELEKYAHSNKLVLMEHAIHAIEFAVNNKLPSIEVFQFKDSEFSITILEKDYLININNIFDYYMKCEVYENCPRIVRLQKMLKEQIGQTINNEK